MKRIPYLNPGTPIIVYLLLMLVLPVTQLLWLSFQPAGKTGLAHYIHLFSSPIYFRVLAVTLKIAAYTTVLAIASGYPVAYLAISLSPKSRNTLLFWILLPFWMSFLVRALSWMVLLGRNGVINQLLMLTGIASAPLDLLYNFQAVIVGMVHALTPLAILTMMAAMQNIDRNLLRAASTLGATPARAFWTVYFPLSLPGLVASAIIVFITSIGFFITPILLGGRKEIMIAQLIVEQIQETLNWGFAGAVSMLLLLVVLMVFFLFGRFVGFSSLTGAGPANRITGSVDSQRRRIGYWGLERLADLFDSLGSFWRRVIPWTKHAVTGKNRSLWAVIGIILAFLSAPMLILIPISFTADKAIIWPPHGFSLQWYQAIAQAPHWRYAALHSIVVGLSTACLSMLIGVPAAFFLVRSSIRWKAGWLTFILMPMIIPRIILAVGLFYLFAQLGLIGSMLGVVLGHTTLALPYVVITTMAALKHYDARFDAAAHSLGAGRLKTLYKVTFPLLSVGLISAFFFAFVMSFDELTIALFITGGLNTTLPKQFWDEVLLNVSPTITAVSTCLFIFVALVSRADRLRYRSLYGV